MKIAVVSAHRGDAALALGLSIGLWLDSGHTVEVINCFSRSEFAPYSDAGSLHANDRMSFVSAVRKREDEAWKKLYRGLLNTTDLNMKDAPLRLHCSEEEVFGRIVDHGEKSALKIAKALSVSRADIVLRPLALDGQIDRLLARDAGSEDRSSDGAIAFYEDLPQASSFSNEAVEELARKVNPDLDPVLLGNVLQDEALKAAVDTKRKIAWCYDSQIDELMTARVAEYCLRYAGRERVWAGAAWPHGTKL